MAEEEKPSGQEEQGEENKGAEQPAPKAPDGSEKPSISPAEQARRDAQSDKDKGASDGKNDLNETVDFLHAREMERVRNEFVSDLLTSDKDTFPNVKANDPMFKYATSKEEVKEIATELQNKFMDMQQDALRSVQTESDQSLTDEEIATKEKELEEEATKEGKSTFSQFYDNLTRRKKA